MKETNVLYNVSLDETNSSVHVSRGNSKIGKIDNFNTLPGSDPIVAKGNTLGNVRGTCDAANCSVCAKYCYAMKSVKQHHNSVYTPWAINTLMLREKPELLESQLNEHIKRYKTKVFRFHSAGEIESLEQLAMYNRIAQANPGVKFYIYTKVFGLLRDYIKQGGTFQPNFIVNLSEWHGNLEKFLLNEGKDVAGEFGKFNIFSYYDQDPSCMQGKFAICPGVSEKGRHTDVHCDKCGMCYRPGSRVRVHPH